GGTVFSGLAYQWGGITGCLAVAAGMLVIAAIFTLALGFASKTEQGLGAR
ncbi:MAG: MFS transporter, partial [Rhodospirillales bacterium]|nr:MFS transporter [Rhodospirillales bacterium]